MRMRQQDRRVTSRRGDCQPLEIIVVIKTEAADHLMLIGREVQCNDFQCGSGLLGIAFGPPRADDQQVLVIR